MFERAGKGENKKLGNDEGSKKNKTEGVTMRSQVNDEGSEGGKTEKATNLTSRRIE